MENAYEALKHSYVQLEVRTMELQSQLAMANRGMESGSFGSINRSGSSSSMAVQKTSIQRRRGSTSANVDIEMPAAITVASSIGMDRGFMVGSPPSSNGSMGSDQSEVIRRALEMGGIVQEGFIADGLDNRSPEIGSAVSAREAFAVASNSSSVNGGQILK